MCNVHFDNINNIKDILHVIIWQPNWLKTLLLKFNLSLIYIFNISPLLFNETADCFYWTDVMSDCQDK